MKLPAEVIIKITDKSLPPVPLALLQQLQDCVDQWVWSVDKQIPCEVLKG